MRYSIFSFLVFFRARRQLLLVVMGLHGLLQTAVADEPATKAQSDQPALLESPNTPDDSACINLDNKRFNIAKSKTTRVDNELFNRLEGKTIRHIQFKTVAIFDEENPDENNRLYLFLNKLHINTRTRVVESQLLFKSGDKIDASSIHESERILRTRSYFTDVSIVPTQVCGDQVDLIVITQDAWSLEPQFSLSRKSSSTQTGAGLNDGNILGTGNSLTVSYTENELRNQVSYDFSNPHFLNKQLDLRVSYGDTSDGHNSLFILSRPFYALDTPWSAGVQLENLSQVDLIRSRDEDINEFRQQSVLQEVFIGKAFTVNDHYTTRWLTGFTNEEENFFSTPNTLLNLPQQDKAAYPWLEYHYIENKFGVYKNVNQIQRAEDIELGKHVRFRLGYGGKSFHNPDDVIRYQGELTETLDLNEKHIFSYDVSVDGKKHLQLDNLNPVLLSTSFSYNYLQDEKNRWYMRVGYDVGQHLPQYKELTVGELTGLRGYPADYIRGNQRFVLTLERRYFSDVHIFNLFRIGGVLFFDSGKSWGLPTDPHTPWLSDVGLGFRFSSTKVRVGNVVHIDLAMPTVKQDGLSRYQLTIGAEQKF